MHEFECDFGIIDLTMLEQASLFFSLSFVIRDKESDATQQFLMT